MPTTPEPKTMSTKPPPFLLLDCAVFCATTLPFSSVNSWPMDWSAAIGATQVPTRIMNAINDFLALLICLFPSVVG